MAKTKKKERVRQYVIVSDYNVIIRPFKSLTDAEDWAYEYAGISSSRPYIVQEVRHIDIASRFNLKQL